jgi:hypothetical protein
MTSSSPPTVPEVHPLSPTLQLPGFLLLGSGNVQPAGNVKLKQLLSAGKGQIQESQVDSLKSSKKGSVHCEKAVTGIINNKKIMKGDELLIL